MKALVLLLALLILAAVTINADPAADLLEAERACNDVYSQIRYARYEDRTAVKKPIQTLRDGEGDCHDMVLVMAAYLDEKGIESDLSFFDYQVYDEGRQEWIVETHVVLVVWGYWFDPTLNARFHDDFPLEYKTTWVVSYSKLLFEWSLQYHVKAAARIEQ